MYSIRSPRPSPGLQDHFCVSLVDDILHFDDIQHEAPHCTHRSSLPVTGLSPGHFSFSTLGFPALCASKSIPGEEQPPHTPGLPQGGHQELLELWLPSLCCSGHTGREKLSNANSSGSFISFHFIRINSCAERIPDQSCLRELQRFNPSFLGSSHGAEAPWEQHTQSTGTNIPNKVGYKE